MDGQSRGQKMRGGNQKEEGRLTKDGSQGCGEGKKGGKGQNGGRRYKYRNRKEKEKEAK